jgi:DNA-directed RNA polymerase sigma subunit (sigma70/sigma32)
MGDKDLLMLKTALIKTKLTDTEFVILARRYGLDDKPRLSVHELSRIFGKSGDEIRRISRIAFFKLRDNVPNDEKVYFDNLIGEMFAPRRI